MAQANRKRRRKHRGTPAGTIEARGRTGRKLTPEERAKPAARKGGATRFDKPPNWKGAAQRAGIAAAIFFIAVVALFRQPIASAIPIGLFMFLVYIPLGYYTDTFLYRRRMAKKANAGKTGKD
ncbi:MAG: hypothetical protein QOJ97_1349 [Solirubrobacteraceae bacterium]|nr:hypothetical protein [Solirubrobacteraceae bacterium]